MIRIRIYFPTLFRSTSLCIIGRTSIVNYMSHVVCKLLVYAQWLFNVVRDHLIFCKLNQLHYFRQKSSKKCEIRHHSWSWNSRTTIRNWARMLRFRNYQTFQISRPPKLCSSHHHNHHIFRSAQGHQRPRRAHHRVVPYDSTRRESSTPKIERRYLPYMSIRVPTEGDFEEHSRVQPLLSCRLHRRVA